MSLQCLVIGGGSSPERNVSLRSAAAVQKAVEELGHSVTFVDPHELDEAAVLAAARSADVVLPILHGKGGEDGGIQSVLEKARVPYFGSNPKACRRTFDKSVFKRNLTDAGIRTPEGQLVDSGSFSESPLTKRPFVIKPVDGGSSIDTFIVRHPGEPQPAIDDALHRHGTMLIERLIDGGSEITVGILGDTPLPVVEIIPPEGREFDYENKYNGATQELCPPLHVSPELQAKAQSLALETHRMLGCRHVSRTDIMIDGAGQLYVIDTNTIPGMTEQSLLPKAAEAAGINWTELVGRFIAMAMSGTRS